MKRPSNSTIVTWIFGGAFGGLAAHFGIAGVPFFVLLILSGLYADDSALTEALRQARLGEAGDTVSP